MWGNGSSRATQCTPYCQRGRWDEARLSKFHNLAGLVLAIIKEEENKAVVPRRTYNNYLLRAALAASQPPAHQSASVGSVCVDRVLERVIRQKYRRERAKE